MESHQIKVAVLEQKIEDLKPIVLRIDKAIEKLSEVNTTVSRMLAVHEERISTAVPNILTNTPVVSTMVRTVSR